jgi:hypothetical protein
MGIASLILGITSLVIGFVPLCGSIALLPAIVGLILGIIDVVKKSKEGGKKGQGLAGLITSTIAIFTIIFWVFVFSVGNTDSNQTTLTPGDSSGASKISSNSSKTYNVGEIYQDGNIAIKFVSANDDFKGYSKYATVKSGYKVLKAEFEFENLSSSDFAVTDWDFDCYADGYDCDSFWSVDDSGFSSTLSAGKKTKGNVYFEVPKDANEIIVEYELNMWSSDRVEFKVK